MVVWRPLVHPVEQDRQSRIQVPCSWTPVSQNWAKRMRAQIPHRLIAHSSLWSSWLWDWIS